MLEYVIDRANINELISFNYELLMEIETKLRTAVAATVDGRLKRSRRERCKENKLR